MSTQLQTVDKGRPNLLAILANKANLDPEEFSTVVKSTCLPSRQPVSDEQFVAFLLVAQKYNLDPLTRQIYAFPDQKTGGIVPFLGVDGWAAMVAQHPNFNGMQFEERNDSDGNLVSITCTIWRKDLGHPVAVAEYFKECRRNTGPWNSHPRRMLRHKAMVQAARYAFGITGVYDKDEAEAIVEAKEEKPVVGTLLERAQGGAGAPKKKRTTTKKAQEQAPPQDEPPAFTATPQVEGGDVELTPFAQWNLNLNEAYRAKVTESQLLDLLIELEESDHFTPEEVKHGQDRWLKCKKALGFE